MPRGWKSHFFSPHPSRRQRRLPWWSKAGQSRASSPNDPLPCLTATFLLCNINEVPHLASSTCAPEEDERKRQMAWRKKIKKIVLWYIFLSKIFGVSYSSGEASKSWMYEWRSKAITIRAVVVRTGSLCPVSESQCSSKCVCVCAL